MKNLCIKTYVKCKQLVDNQRGAQAIEWIALAGIVVLIFAAISQFFEGKTASKLGQTIMDKLNEFIGNVG